jgi:hypothetical protein
MHVLLDVLPLADPKVPMGQPVHADSPLLWPYVPGAQTRHALADDARVPWLYLPAPHVLHVAWPLVSWYEPCGHSEHSEACLRPITCPP